MLKIGVIGPLGVGKSSLIKRLERSLELMGKKVKVFGEPAMVEPTINKVLEKFYKDTNTWAYPLEISAAAGHEAIYTEISEMQKNKEYDAVIVDTPSSSFIYSRIFVKNGIFSDAERKIVDTIYKPFHFDNIIVLNETADETIRRIMERHRNMELDNLGYIHQHVSDYNSFVDEYINTLFPDSNITKLNALPNLDTKEYNELINSLVEKIFRD
jgi:deoxyadenosine/deoxycytidine kinase